MLADFVIQAGEARQASSIPVGGVVREGDGTMSVWVTSDGHRFSKRTVTLGTEQDGLLEIKAGANPGERVATDGALFLSNAAVQAAR